MIIVYKKSNILIYFLGNRFYSIANVVMFAVVVRNVFMKKNELVDRYQRQSKEFKQSIALELIHGKSFKDVADRFHTSTSTVIRRFDTINAEMLKEPKQLPSVIAIDE